MTAKKSNFTAALEILLAANHLDSEGKEEFSEWDLTVATWNKNKNRFGCRGYEGKYPDHKRVMMEIMGTTKKDNPIRKGWIKRVKPNFYSITPLGRSEAERQREIFGEIKPAERSAQNVYDAVHKYVDHPVFRKFCKDSDEPKTWLGAAAFLALTKYESRHLEDKMNAARASIQNALSYLEATKNDQLRRGVTGGGITITKPDLLKVKEFLLVIEKRFHVQLEAIRKRPN